MYRASVKQRRSSSVTKSLKSCQSTRENTVTRRPRSQNTRKLRDSKKEPIPSGGQRLGQIDKVLNNKTAEPDSTAPSHHFERGTSASRAGSDTTGTHSSTCIARQVPCNSGLEHPLEMLSCNYYPQRWAITQDTWYDTSDFTPSSPILPSGGSGFGTSECADAQTSQRYIKAPLPDHWERSVASYKWPWTEKRHSTSAPISESSSVVEPQAIQDDESLTAEPFLDLNQDSWAVDVQKARQMFTKNSIFSDDGVSGGSREFAQQEPALENSWISDVAMEDIMQSTICFDTVRNPESIASRAGSSRSQRTRDVENEINEDGDGSVWGSDDPTVTASRDNKSGSSSQGFACPFFRRSPIRHMDCLSLKLTRIQDVKQHIRRRHSPPRLYCPTCYEKFKSPDPCDAHIRGRDCVSRDPFTAGYISPGAGELLRLRLSRTKDPDEQWYSIWDIIFDGVHRPPHPHLGMVAEEIVGVIGDFWKREGDDIIDDIFRDRAAQAVSGSDLNLLMNKLLDVLRSRAKQSTKDPRSEVYGRPESNAKSRSQQSLDKSWMTEPSTWWAPNDYKTRDPSAMQSM